ncbi:MAG: YCF48-related protein, partial [bacterium]|nr:YCF48-related protein [bacterium]
MNKLYTIICAIIWFSGLCFGGWTQENSGVSSVLFDVYFVNDKYGWAVGGRTRPTVERGVILHSKNGGKSWVEQPFPLPDTVDAELSGVCFSDTNNGWAVGSGRIVDRRRELWLIKTDGAGNKLWDKLYGGRSYDYGYSVEQTSGGYIIAGYTWSFGAGNSDVWLLKTDGNGDTLWTKTYGGTDSDEGYSMVLTTDGGYIIAGCTESYGAGDWDVWLVKMDASGNKLWDKTFGGTGYDAGMSVAQTGDGGYIITGITTSSGSHDAWLIKTDAEGNEVWDKTYGGTGWDEGHSVVNTVDGGYIITGVYNNSYLWLIRTDSNGDTIWTETYSGAYTYWNSGNSVIQTQDGNYVVTGSYGVDCNNWGLWLLKIDTEGNKLWDKTFETSHRARGYEVRETEDGGYIVVGTLSLHYSTGADIYLLKTDAEGNKLWDKLFQGAGNSSDWGFSVVQATDGGYVITGCTERPGGGNLVELILHTTDGGKTWVEQYAGLNRCPQRVWCVDPLNAWITPGGPYYNNQVILHTSDGGNSWGWQTWFGYNGGMFGIYFSDLQHGWACGGTEDSPATRGYIIRTTNGGLSWELSYHWPSTIPYTWPFMTGVHFPVNNSTGWACGWLASFGGANSEERIIYTTNGGQSWDIQWNPTGEAAGMLWDIHFGDLQNGWCVGDKGKIICTHDGGATWSYDTSGVTADLWGVHFVDANNGWAVGEGGTILKYWKEGTEESSNLKPQIPKLEVYPNP